MPKTIRQSLRHEIDPIKGSRFIVDVVPVADEDQAQLALVTIRAEFRDASHHCSAWRMASPAIERANDDGEPSGSAGKPILAQLIGRDLVNVAVVVTRWFGGTKLGVGGLVRAYGGAAGETLDTAQLHPWVMMSTVSLSHAYAFVDPVERLVEELGAEFIERTFNAEVLSLVRIATVKIDTFSRRLADITSGVFRLDQ